MKLHGDFKFFKLNFFFRKTSQQERRLSSTNFSLTELKTLLGIFKGFTPIDVDITPNMS